MYYEFDFPSHLRWLGNKYYKNIVDIGGLGDVAFEIISKATIKGNGIDVGCGTGYLSLQLARKTTLKMHGFEILDHFVENANNQTKKENLNCIFTHGDIWTALLDNRFKKKFSIAIAITTGDIFKSLIQTVKYLNEIIKNNGYILIGWVADKNKVNNDLCILGKYLENEGSYEICETYTEDTVYNFKDDVNNSKIKLKEDFKRLSIMDAEILNKWALKRFSQLSCYDGRVSTKAAILIKKSIIRN